MRLAWIGLVVLTTSLGAHAHGTGDLPDEPQDSYPPAYRAGRYEPEVAIAQRPRILVRFLGLSGGSREGFGRPTKARFEFDIYNRTERRLTLVDRELFGEWAPRNQILQPAGRATRVEGNPQVEPDARERIQIVFPLGRRIDPADVQTVRLHWAVRSDYGTLIGQGSAFQRDDPGPDGRFVYVPWSNLNPWLRGRWRRFDNHF